MLKPRCIEVAHSKRRGQDSLALRRKTANPLFRPTETKLPETLTFTMPNLNRLAHIVRADLTNTHNQWLDSITRRHKRSDASAQRLAGDLTFPGKGKGQPE